MKNLIGEKVVSFLYDGEDSLTIAQEAFVPEGYLNRWKLIWNLLIDKNFHRELTSFVKYAMMHRESYRGTGSSDVLLAMNNIQIEKLF